MSLSDLEVLKSYVYLRFFEYCQFFLIDIQSTKQHRIYYIGFKNDDNNYINYYTF